MIIIAAGIMKAVSVGSIPGKDLLILEIRRIRRSKNQYMAVS